MAMTSPDGDLLCLCQADAWTEDGRCVWCGGFKRDPLATLDAKRKHQPKPAFPCPEPDTCPMCDAPLDYRNCAYWCPNHGLVMSCADL